MKGWITLLSTLALVLSFGSSHADSYIGVSYGKTSPDEDGIDDSTGYKITFGYNADNHIAIEGSYTNLGEFNAENELLSALELDLGVPLRDASVDIDGIELAVLVRAPLTDTASIFGRVGIFLWDAELTIDTASFGSFSESDDGTDPFFGAGVSVDIAPTVALNFEYIVYEATDTDIDFLGGGLAIRF